MVDQTEDPPTARRCEVCDTPLVPSDGPGRPARYCSNGCKTQAYWQRKLGNQELEVGESTATQPSGLEGRPRASVTHGLADPATCDHSKAKKGPLAGTLRCPCGMVRGKDGVWR